MPSALTVSLLAVCVAAPAGAQTLAEAAARAEAQRKAKQGETVVLTEANLAREHDPELRDFRLTPELVEAYVTARKEILEARIRSRDVDGRMLAAESQAAHPLDLLATYQLEPDVVRLLDQMRLAPRVYLLTEAAFQRGRLDASRPASEDAALPPARAANAQLLRADKGAVVANALWRWSDSEKWLAQRRGPPAIR